MSKNLTNVLKSIIINPRGGIMNINELATFIEKTTQWERLYRGWIQMGLQKDFKAGGDNFVRSNILELGFESCTELKYVDRTGCDFILEIDGHEVRIETKFTTKARVHKKTKIKPFKMKNFRGKIDEEAFQKYKDIDECDFVLLIDIKNYDLILIDISEIKNTYQMSGDGIFTDYIDINDCVMLKNPVIFPKPLVEYENVPEKYNVFLRKLVTEVFK